jgi:hypothetical protein
MPVSIRSTGLVSTSDSLTAFCGSALTLLFVETLGGVYSDNEFHAPQEGHLPSHFALSAPHSLHKNIVFVLCFAIISESSRI